MQSKGKQTSRGVQTSLFIGSLMKEMGKLAANKGRLVCIAEEYISQGCSRDETGELLVIDGFNRDMVAAWLSSTAAAEPADQDDSPAWGFEICGSCGDKITHEDLDIEIRASTRDEAVVKLQAVMDGDRDAGLEKIIDVFQLK